MSQLALHFAPNTCARVPLVALEEIGVPFSVKVIVFMQGQHRSAEYLKLNPSGKVPTLIVDGRPITENVAILLWLADTFPHANLLPEVAGLDRYKQISDLAYCASGLHPIVTRLRIPHFFCDLDEARERVFDMAEVAMKLQFQVIEDRLSGASWWYGETWSIVDAYLNWVWFRVTGTRFDASGFPNIARHADAMAQRPAVQRMLARNQAIEDDLNVRGLGITFDGPGAVRAAAK